MINKLIDIAFNGFFSFVGVIMLFALIAALVVDIFNIFRSMWIRFLRMLVIRKHGYPPEHCDADGDLKG